MIAFIDDQRSEYGVEPICAVLPIAPSTYYARKAIEGDPSLSSDRAKRDAWLGPEIRRVWTQDFQVYGAERVYRQCPETPRFTQLGDIQFYAPEALKQL